MAAAADTVDMRPENSAAQTHFPNKAAPTAIREKGRTKPGVPQAVSQGHAAEHDHRHQKRRRSRKLQRQPVGRKNQEEHQPQHRQNLAARIEPMQRTLEFIPAVELNQVQRSPFFARNTFRWLAPPESKRPPPITAAAIFRPAADCRRWKLVIRQRAGQRRLSAAGKTQPESNPLETIRRPIRGRGDNISSCNAQQ